MTEAEWLACDEPATLLYLSSDETQKRKVWLFGCACCRRILDLLIHPSSRTAIEVAERYADGNAEQSELNDAAETAKLASDLAFGDAGPFTSLADPTPGCYDTAAFAAYKLVRPSRPIGWPLMAQVAEAASDASGRGTENAWQIALLRDIFGNPFRPIAIDPRCLTSTVVNIASAIYEERAFERMPILADALMDAGCDNEEVIAHCRSNGVHARGCWVVDLLLRKE